jgi:hypothetical protein
MITQVLCWSKMSKLLRLVEAPPPPSFYCMLSIVYCLLSVGHELLVPLDRQSLVLKADYIGP